MLLDNTQLMRGAGGVKTPVTQLVKMGLARRGLMGYHVEEITDVDMPDRLYTTATPLATRRGLGDLVSAQSDPGGIMAAVNSEIAWFVNLARANQGRAPLDPGMSAPGVRVGIDTASLRPLVPWAAAGFLAWLIFRRR